MQAREYLQQLKRLDVIINQKIKEVEDLRLQAQNAGSIEIQEKVQKSSSGNAPFIKLIEKIIDLEEEINTEIDNLVDKKHEIINQIQGLKNVNYISLLFKRYVEFKNLKIIACEMNYTYQYTLELHDSALKEFETTYENIYNSYCNL